MSGPNTTGDFGTIRTGDTMSDREAWELHQKMEAAGLVSESARLRAHFTAERAGNSVEGVLRTIATHIATSTKEMESVGQTTKEAMAMAIAAHERSTTAADKSSNALERLAKAEEDRIEADRLARSAANDLQKLNAEHAAERDKLRSQRFALIITSVVGPLVLGLIALAKLVLGTGAP